MNLLKLSTRTHERILTVNPIRVSGTDISTATSGASERDPYCP